VDTEVWALFDCGDLYALYADEATANAAAKKLCDKIRRDMPEHDYTYQVGVIQMTVHSTPELFRA
jgi:hypothetical protein